MSDPKIDRNSETWLSVLDAIHKDLNKLRDSREQLGADMRHLDRDLGGIKALQRIIELPAKQAKKPPEPIRGSGVRVPGVHTRVMET